VALADLLINTVAVTRRAWTNVSGAATPTPTTADLACSVQPMRASRVERYGLTAGETGYTVYFAADPLVNAGDSIAWGSRTLAVLGPARDEAGRSIVWAVDCLETK
jgi:hypothetical protein